ncbi:MAG: hypothetical protein JWO12_1008 [Frankiales bacterium]|nr:hypothetical protein [Frankiales bacterium]
MNRYQNGVRKAGSFTLGSGHRPAFAQELSKRETKGGPAWHSHAHNHAYPMAAGVDLAKPGKTTVMVDTKKDLRSKSQLAFVLSASVLLFAIYLSFTDLPPMKVAHGRFWIVSIFLSMSVLSCAGGVLDRHLMAKAPDSRPLPTMAQRQTGLLLTGGEALAMIVVGAALLGQGRTGMGWMAVASSVGFAVVAMLVERQPTRD